MGDVVRRHLVGKASQSTIVATHEDVWMSIKIPIHDAGACQVTEEVEEFHSRLKPVVAHSFVEEHPSIEVVLESDEVQGAVLVPVHGRDTAPPGRRGVDIGVLDFG